MLSFFEQYNSLAREDKSSFRDKVQAWCKIQPSTFHRWIKTMHIPPLKRTVIAQHMGQTEADLFPQNADV